MSFSYKVNGEENWDYFIFEIDGQEMLRESIQNDWKTVTFPLGKGVHRLSFIYSKDFSITQGEDMAKIREIEITGISNVVNECNICKAGIIIANNNFNMLKEHLVLKKQANVKYVQKIHFLINQDQVHALLVLQECHHFLDQQNAI